MPEMLDTAVPFGFNNSITLQFSRQSPWKGATDALSLSLSLSLSRRNGKQLSRRLFLEPLERRYLLTADVNGDGFVLPSDALLVANACYLGGLSAGELALDVNGDSQVTSADFDAVIAELAGGRTLAASAASEGEGSNNPPTAENDGYQGRTTGDRQLTVDATTGVLANDSDLDSDPLTASIVTLPSHAESFTLNPDGSFVYKPQPGWVGEDQFVYAASDGTDSDNATVSIFTPPVPVGVIQSPIGDPEPPELTEQSNIAASSYWVYLPDGPVNFDITIPFQVLYQKPPPGDPAEKVTGNGILGVDFSLSHTQSVTIRAGTQGTFVDLTVLPDKYVEGNERAGIQLQYVAGQGSPFTIVEAESVAEFVIRDNDYWKWDEQLDFVSIPLQEIDPSFGDVWDWCTDGSSVWWCDSIFGSLAHWHVRSDGLTANAYSEWKWYERNLLTITEHYDLVGRELMVDFDFEALTGVITPRSGSGLSGPPFLNDAATDIDYSYVVDNSGAFLHTATVSFHAESAVVATYSTSNTGGVGISGKIGDGVEIGPNGSWSANITVNRTDGGSILDENKTYVFKLRSTEDPLE